MPGLLIFPFLSMHILYVEILCWVKQICLANSISKATRMCMFVPFISFYPEFHWRLLRSLFFLSVFACSVHADVPRTPDTPFSCPSVTPLSCCRALPSPTLNGVLLFLQAIASLPLKLCRHGLIVKCLPLLLPPWNWV